MRVNSLLLAILCLGLFIALPGVPRAFAEELPWLAAPVPTAPVLPVEGPPETPTAKPQEIPAWLQAHAGTGDGQISPVVLERARAHYLKKMSEGAIKNPCYFAKDATRPAGTGRRFYEIGRAHV